MKSRASLMAMLAIAAGALLSAATGCELIASVDRSKIETGGAGGGGTAGATTGGGGATGGGGMTTGGGGTGGVTVMCTDPATDCTPPTGECKVAYCDDQGMCAEKDADDGADAKTQTTGDCKKMVCMSGAPTAMNDDTDPLDDNNECTADSCDNGNPVSMPTAIDTACNEGGNTHCDGAGVCVECLDNGDCSVANPTCKNNACIPADCSNGVQDNGETDVDCGGPCGATCITDQGCAVAGDCVEGVCDGTKCLAPTCNDNVQNGDETDQDCGGSCQTKCGAGKGCDAGADCKGGQCTGPAGTCVPNCSDTEMNNAETDVDCGGGTCNGCAVGQDCAGSDANCVGTAYCDGGNNKCAAKKPQGDPCGGNSQCTSGACTDGVCCNVACGGTCQACNVAGNVGTCSPVPTETDPASECAGSDVCNGVGACAKALGTACAAGECASGNCVDSVCCNSACTNLCQACSNAKTGQANGTCSNVTMGTDPDNECAGALTCTGGACSAKLADGASCTVDGECTNNHCVDGVCCNVACGGACQACSAAKKGSGANGVCGFVGFNTDPDNECTFACDGAGACQLDIGGSCTGANQCNSGACADGVCCNNTCTGTCQACSAAAKGQGTNGTCGPIVLGGTDNNATTTCLGPTNACDGASACKLANGQACTMPAECASGNCASNLCAP